ncbi:MAG: hypothetical protein MUP48_02650, partial [Wolbachia endosymbiont of Homalodisca vitripennis]|nr:hypothetical protein [Wolbachia endosymbiont of Homalodisca vitripennis]MCJ7476531.1 hypothetical protein [Wolbachia endosymbiont of Homalodisca vitripennis]
DKNNTEDIEIAIDSTIIFQVIARQMVQIESIAAMSKQDVMLEIGSKKVIAEKYSGGVYSDHYVILLQGLMLI